MRHLITISTGELVHLKGWRIGSRVPIPSRLRGLVNIIRAPSAFRVELWLQMHFGEFLALKMLLVVATFTILMYERVMN